MRILFIFILTFLANIQLVKAQTIHSKNDEVASIPVTVKMLSDLLVERELKAAAECISVNTTLLSSEVVGVIKKIGVDVGQTLGKGDIMLELDSTDYKLTYKQAQANLSSNAAKIEQAQLRLKRANDLSKSKYIAADDLLARQTDLNVFNAEKLSLQIASEQAQRNIEKSIIKAPFDGVVYERFANVGSYVSPGVALFNFVQSNQLEVNADIPMHLSASLNQASHIYFNSGDINYSVKLLRLSPVIQQGMRTQKARFSFSGQQAPIGASGELIWKISGGLLPAGLVVNRNGQLGVFSIANDTAIFIPLSNAQEGRPVAITLGDNTPIIVGGRERLQDGVKITRQ